MVKFFTKEQEQRIVAAIRESEGHTSGEIRVHLERELIGDALNVAARVFHELEMDRFAIIGDKGINEKVPVDFWDDVRDIMQQYFRQGKFTEGVIEGVKLSGQKLKEHFPRKSDDRNELSDEISYG